MKLIFILLLFINTAVLAQSSADYFNRAANEYIYKNEQIALNTIDTGLAHYPEDKNLNNLKEKIKKDKEEQEQQKQQEQQSEEDQQNKEQEQQSEEDENAEQKNESQQAQPEETEEEGQEMDQPPLSRGEKLEELNLTEEKARMILEAMKNNEIQYIQQNKRKATKKPDSNKPDW